jgi:hypothetical protein
MKWYKICRCLCCHSLKKIAKKGIIFFVPEFRPLAKTFSSFFHSYIHNPLKFNPVKKVKKIISQRLKSAAKQRRDNIIPCANITAPPVTQDTFQSSSISWSRYGAFTWFYNSVALDAFKQ